MPDLFAEMTAKDASPVEKESKRQFIAQKAGPDDFAIGKRYATHEDAIVRCAAADVLGATGKADAHPLLSKLTEDDEVDVRDAACAALGNIRTKASIETLAKICGKESEKAKVRGTAMGSLKKLVPDVQQNNYKAWAEWWRLEGKDYKLKDPAP